MERQKELENDDREKKEYMEILYTLERTIKNNNNQNLQTHWPLENKSYTLGSLMDVPTCFSKNPRAYTN